MTRMMMANEEDVIRDTRAWLQNVVIHFNFCPFAKRELDNGKLRFQVCQSSEMEDCLQALINECEFLDNHPEISTSLLLIPKAVADFDRYLYLIEMSELLLVKQGYEGVYQLASFHPDYCFAGSTPDDPANYTNRSPYPMLHIIRESSMEKALESYPQPESIPEKNIEVARSQGKEKMQTLLDSCKNPYND